MIKNTMLLFMAGLLLNGCQKMSQPPFGDYPVDANPPGGPLKFYAAMDEKNVDSIRANFGTFNDASIVDDGVSGKCAQFDGSKNGFINYPSANDFGQSTNFTISFWINITMAQKDNNHAVGVLAFANSDNFWGNITFYADNNTKSPSDSMDLKIHFGASDGGDNWNFAGYNFGNAWPKMYDGNWHQVAFTYDASSKVGTVYRDGEQFDQKTDQDIAFTSPSQLVLGGFQQAAGITDSYDNNSWMAGFPGKMDNVRLYGEALSAADVKSLYDNKE
ncbi:MAG: LamG domain-containing protein [Bacteroidetes bacterium]|nr:LamG domain-containing protein [Bacteroidota bacterium]